MHRLRELGSILVSLFFTSLRFHRLHVFVCYCLHVSLSYRNQYIISESWISDTTRQVQLSRNLSFLYRKNDTTKKKKWVLRVNKMSELIAQSSKVNFTICVILEIFKKIMIPSAIVTYFELCHFCK